MTDVVPTPRPMPSTVGARWRPRACTVALVCWALPALFVACLAYHPADVAAAPLASYSAVAAANGVINTVSGKSIPAGIETETDGPTAQSAVDSSGRSTGLASLLYPGTYLLALPGLAASQGAPETPPYPLLVQSDGAHPSAEASGSGYDLKAASTDRSSQATASVGSSGAPGTIGSASAATAVHADPSSGLVTATASSVTEVIEAPPLRIGRVESQAAAARDADGHLTRSSSLSVGAMTVNGIHVDLTDKGLILPGQAVPLPGNPIADQLRTAGITVSYVAARDLPDGVMSAGVDITLSAPGSGVTTTMTLGRSLALAGREAASTSTAATPLPSVTPLTTGGITPVAAPAGGLITPAPALGTAGVAPPGPPASSTPAAQFATPAPPSLAPAVTTHIGQPLSATSFYLVLVAAALAALAVGQLIRWGGIRWAKSS